MRIYTIGHGTRPLDELVACLTEARVATLVDVRRFPSSRRNPQFNQAPLAEGLEASGIAYRHEIDLGGRRTGEAGEERFTCIETPAFRSYAARMSSVSWQAALARGLAVVPACFMCAETLWWRCHRRLIAELLAARGHEVIHIMRPGKVDPHRPAEEAEARDGHLYLCGELVA